MDPNRIKFALIRKRQTGFKRLRRRNKWEENIERDMIRKAV
jgi:hypothetical protein